MKKRRKKLFISGRRSFDWRFVLMLCMLVGPGASAEKRLAPNGKPYSEIAADPAAGFNYPYLLYIPADAAGRCFPFLVVEPNNGAIVDPDPDQLDREREEAVKLLTHAYMGNAAAERLGAPLLVPIFPRPKEGDSDLYTHSLSREAMLVTSGKLKRLDLQLMAMITDAEQRLRAGNRPVLTKVLLAGFSASGMFASRFVFLHPELIEAAAFGGVNGFIMLPLSELAGHKLTYPIGLADYDAIAGHAFNRRLYDRVPQLALMGANDTNDAVRPGDAYDARESGLINTLLSARMLPDRWRAVQAVFAAQGSYVSFRTYPDIGHGLDERIYRDVETLFAAAATKDPDAQRACKGRVMHLLTAARQISAARR